MGFSPWQRLKSKRISYLTLPLIIMATMVEFVILATGWKYQQTVCLPKGMGVTFFGIGRSHHPGGGVAQTAPGHLDRLSHRLGKGVHDDGGAASDLCADLPIGQGYGGL
jgi:hypothetical protein